METILTILIIIGIFIFLNRFLKSRETFDRNTVMYVPQSHTRYGLRGEKLCKDSLAKMYYGPYRQIRLDHTGGNIMYISDRTPAEEGIQGCNKVPCPKNLDDEVDNMDTCWYCGSAKQYCECQFPLLDKDPSKCACLDKIPDLWPH